MDNNQNVIKKLTVDGNGHLQESNKIRIGIPTKLMKPAYKPNRGRVLLDPIPMKSRYEKNDKGLIIPAKYLQDPEMKGIVVAIGDGVEQFQVGDVVNVDPGENGVNLPNPTFIDGHAYMLMVEGAIQGKYTDIKIGQDE